MNNVNIKILFPSLFDKSDEEKASEQLKLSFETYFSKHEECTGSISIFHNVHLYETSTNDIDILVVGELRNTWIPIEGYGTCEIKSFCTCVELKHSINRNIFYRGSNFYIKYQGEPIEDNVSEQSFKEKDSFRTYLYSSGIPGYVTNTIWFKGINEEELKSKVEDQGISSRSHNAFAGLPDFEQFIDKVARQGKLYNNGYVCADRSGCMYKQIIRVLGQSHQGMNINTLKVLNLFDEKKVKLIYDEYIGTGDISVISGRAGTGKTFVLLQLASYLTMHKKPCTFLTYNHALINDIQHLLKQRTIPIQGRDFPVRTMQSFFQDQMKKAHTWVDTDSSYIKNYEHNLNIFSNWLDSNGEMKCDGYVLVDEAQDWTTIEKVVLLKLFCVDHIIVADGIDQFVYGGQKLEWGESTPKKVSLRQKNNIVNFINKFAEKTLGPGNWSVDPSENWTGGTIIIRQGYNYEQHANLVKNCQDNGCSNYDILFLAPSEMISNGKFGNYNSFKKKNILVYDGIDDANRMKGYSDPEDSLCRVYTYESCRGLEGWCTVCLRFDRLIEEKISYFKDDANVTKEDKAFLWSLMPLTRAVDTLVISIKDANSRVGRILKEIYNESRDYVVWDVKPEVR